MRTNRSSAYTIPSNAPQQAHLENQAQQQTPQGIRALMICGG